MANAIARMSRLENAGDGRTNIVLQVMFSGDGLDGGVMDTEVPVLLLGSEQPAAIRTAISTAIAAWPASQGYTWTVPTGNMVLPTFQKG